MAKRTIKICTTAVIAALLALLSTVAFRPSSAFAQETAHAEQIDIELNPIEANTGITYFYFDGTKAIHASENGVTVTAGHDIFSVSLENKVAHKLNVCSDKTHDLGKFTLSLVDGALRSDFGETTAEYNGNGAYSFIDFDTTADKIYAITTTELVVLGIAETSFDETTASPIEFNSDKYDNITASYITVADGVPYIAVNSLFGAKHDICSVNVETGKLTQALIQSDPILSLASLGSKVYSLTRDSVVCYNKLGGGLIETNVTYGTSLTDIYGYNGAVYALNSLDAVIKLSPDLQTERTLVASADGAEGFFNTPLGASVKNSTLYVADAANGRVAAFGDSAGYLEKQFIRPVAAVSDSAGALYVAHRYNEVVKIVSGEEHTVKVDGIISDIAVDADKTLYILTTDGNLFYSVDSAAPEFLVNNGGYKAIALGVGSDQLYALTDSNVQKITLSGGKATLKDYCAVDDSYVSLAVDVNGTVFLLARDGITRVAAYGNATDYALKADGAHYSLGFTSGKILLSTVKNCFVEYGDAVIVDTYKHRLFTVSGAEDALNIKLIDKDYERPDEANDRQPSYYDGLIRTALYDTQVFEYPMETPSVYTIAKGRKVIVPEYEVDGAREYSLILIDNLATGELIQGYVYKDSLSDPLPYVAAPSNVGTVYSSATPVYKWPSPNSPTVTGFSAIERGSEFTILDFVESYRDDYNNLWYRIQISGEFEGYMLASNLSMMNYEPIFIRPAYNAEIISYEGSEFAIGYMLVDGEYKEISATFPTGTKVEVVGTFDTSLEYTQIKYLDPDLGTLTCYVKTVYLKYNGVNIVLIVAIIVIIITVVLFIIIMARVFYTKKKRVTAPIDN